MINIEKRDFVRMSFYLVNGYDILVASKTTGQTIP